MKARNSVVRNLLLASWFSAAAMGTQPAHAGVSGFGTFGSTGGGFQAVCSVYTQYTWDSLYIDTLTIPYFGCALMIWGAYRYGNGDSVTVPYLQEAAANDRSEDFPFGCGQWQVITTLRYHTYAPYSATGEFHPGSTLNFQCP